MSSDTNWRKATITLSFAAGKTRNASNDVMLIDTLVERHFTQHKVRENKDSFGFSCELINDAPRGPSGKNLRNEKIQSPNTVSNVRKRPISLQFF